MRTHESWEASETGPVSAFDRNIIRQLVHSVKEWLEYETEEGVTLVAAASRDAEVLAVVEQLVARNTELEMLLAQVRTRAGNRSERIAQEQLDLRLERVEKAIQATFGA